MNDRTPQNRIQSLLNRLVAEETERGLQVAAYIDGVLVVNAWAGIADNASGRPVGEQTLFPVFSATKAVTATVMHRLVEQGRIGYDDPIASVWPEFAAHGKGRVTLRQALSHASGIPQMPRGIGHRELCDWDVMCAAIADLEPLWTPGTRIEYHAITYGWIVGEVARRVSGRSFARLLASEVTEPLGLGETMYVGIPDAAESRIATLEEPGAVAMPDDGKPQSIPTWMGPLAAWMNRPDARRACLPASNGVMSALALARHYAALLPGDGELLSPHRVDAATEIQKPDHPENDDYPRNWGLGYQLGGGDSIYGGSSSFGHMGYGGSIGFADRDLGLAVGLTKNRFNTADSTRIIVDELRRAIAGVTRQR